MIREIDSFLTCSNICWKAFSCSGNEVGFNKKMFWRSRFICSGSPLWICLNLSGLKPPSVSMKIILLPFLAPEVARIMQKFDLPEAPGP